MVRVNIMGGFEDFFWLEWCGSWVLGEIVGDIGDWGGGGIGLEGLKGWSG